MRGEGDMKKSVYDPDADGVIACEQTEADMKKATYDSNEDGIIATAQTEADMEKSTYDSDEDGRIDNPTKKKTTVVVSDDLIGSDDAEESTTNESYTKLKELTFNIGNDIDVKTGVPLRVKFDLKSDTEDKGAWAYVARNGSQVGTAQINTSTSYQTLSEDISNWDDGDLIQLFVRMYTPGDYYAVVRNFRVYATMGYTNKEESITAT